MGPDSLASPHHLKNQGQLGSSPPQRKVCLPHGSSPTQSRPAVASPAADHQVASVLWWQQVKNTCVLAYGGVHQRGRGRQRRGWHLAAHYPTLICSRSIASIRLVQYSAASFRCCVPRRVVQVQRAGAGVGLSRTWPAERLRSFPNPVGGHPTHAGRAVAEFTPECAVVLPRPRERLGPVVGLVLRIMLRQGVGEVNPDLPIGP